MAGGTNTANILAIATPKIIKILNKYLTVEKSKLMIVMPKYMKTNVSAIYPNESKMRTVPFLDSSDKFCIV
eukprot:CAMPEP_0114576076 /NCGR_PEP_ID=MMETSP0125-20121206/873_1 /TAXON_ID=485358 ORGANISM="Aristerostoma sp., Strain ATCC 50986" /NCGR_SAMPLE_ID=MMETSP0125 /ASSEMBLY_ACC=CAM_ASM_000245 /LENGTH=70 /DNA_ID=CAMNT_0001764299 /DNA_START=488 /DNA_END=700 /DNA_ORIENTATION=-